MASKLSQLIIVQEGWEVNPQGDSDLTSMWQLWWRLVLCWALKSPSVKELRSSVTACPVTLFSGLYSCLVEVYFFVNVKPSKINMLRMIIQLIGLPWWEAFMLFVFSSFVAPGSSAVSVISSETPFCDVFSFPPLVTVHFCSLLGGLGSFCLAGTRWWMRNGPFWWGVCYSFSHAIVRASALKQLDLDSNTDFTSWCLYDGGQIH